MNVVMSARDDAALLVAAWLAKDMNRGESLDGAAVRRLIERIEAAIIAERNRQRRTHE
jgi:hypothetical protein